MAVRAQVEPRHLARRRRLRPVRGAQHRAQLRRGPPRRDRRPRGARRARDRRLAQLLRLLLDARRRVDRAAAQPTLDVVDRRASRARSTGCAGTRTARGGPRRPRRTAGAAAARGRSASRRAGRATRPRTAPRARRARSRAGRARRRPTARRARSAPARTPRRISSSNSSPTSSSEPRAPAPSRKRTAASSDGGGGRRLVEERALEMRERRMLRTRPSAAGAPRRARGERGEIVGGARSDANATRPGSYGSETSRRCAPRAPRAASTRRR